MNVSELARRLRVSPKELFELLPEFGFDIGKRAIKVDDRVANQIMRAWPRFYREREARLMAEKKQKEIEARKMRMEGSGPIVLPAIMTVKDFAAAIDLPVNTVIKELMGNGILATLNERIDFNTASIIAEDLGLSVAQEQDAKQTIDQSTDEKLKSRLDQAKEAGVTARPPVVVVMGHVDHGKTKLLDAIRQTNIVDTEHGGITQHIGAYQVEKNGQKITFIDTPGHEAFTAMRSRGAKVADIAILVVAADDGIKPQTIEAIQIIQAIKLPFVVAINKIDKPEANIEKVKQELAQQNLLTEDWGGKVITVPISAKAGTNIDQLLETILLVAEMQQSDIVANADVSAFGTVIEAHKDPSEGAVATVLVQGGTLRPNDIMGIDGGFYGRVRAMKNWQGLEVKEALPGTPVKIIGWKTSPKVGDILEVAVDLKDLDAKKVKKFMTSNEQSKVAIKQENEDDEQRPAKTLNIVLKTDVLGSAEAIMDSLDKLEKPKSVNYKIISRGLGNITETDVLQALGDNAVVLGFNVLTTPTAKQMAEDKGVEVKSFKIIYELLDLVKEKLNSMIEIEIIEIDLGTLEVLAVFKKVKDGQVIGGKVKTGKVEVGQHARLIRDNLDLARMKIVELQAGKQNVKDVDKGTECGLKIDSKIDVVIGDLLQVYREERVEKKIK